MRYEKKKKETKAYLYQGNDDLRFLDLKLVDEFIKDSVLRLHQHVKVEAIRLPDHEYTSRRPHRKSQKTRRSKLIMMVKFGSK